MTSILILTKSGKRIILSAKDMPMKIVKQDIDGKKEYDLKLTKSNKLILN